MSNEIQFLLYNMPNADGKVQVVIKDETLWCTQKAMAQLFGVGIPAISKHLKNIFDEGEVDRFYINFCDPWPKKRHAKRRLTHVGFLEKYRKFLKKPGELHFKTDNRPLFDFSPVKFTLFATTSTT